MTLTAKQALMQYIADPGMTEDELTEARHDHWGLTVFEYGNAEYAIGTDEEANEAAREYIADSLWAFNTSFIASHVKPRLNDKAEKALQKMQSELCEDANDLVTALINDLDHFITDAIHCDGRGHFLSSYDSEEIELNGGFYAYRIN